MNLRLLDFDHPFWSKLRDSSFHHFLGTLIVPVFVVGSGIACFASCPSMEVLIIASAIQAIAGASFFVLSRLDRMALPNLPTGNSDFSQRWIHPALLIDIWKGTNLIGWIAWAVLLASSIQSAIAWWAFFQCLKLLLAFIAGSNNAERINQGQSPIGNYLNNQDS
jgi:hypothetical protein